MPFPAAPLRFEPVLKRYLWGGRQLGELFNKPLGPENDYAESWELVDREPEQSRVIGGPLVGKSLRELLTNYPRELLGRHVQQPRFPLLVKLLDAAQLLSVQVHPNDGQAAQMTPRILARPRSGMFWSHGPGANSTPGSSTGSIVRSWSMHLNRGKSSPV